MWAGRRTCTFLSAILALSTPAATLAESHLAPTATEPIEEIIVTGSRIKRSTYTSIPPLQIIPADESRDVGLIDAALILQETAVADGLQLDLTLQGYVTDNGPGASTISLRGLGEARTLVLINGRRVGPSGVEGAPTAPDLNLVPSAFVRQYDLLLDGASSIYGSDAIAGVANVILRNDFSGLELEAWSGLPDQGGGQELTIGLAWGVDSDRGYFGIGVEHEDNADVRLNERRWSSGCERHVEVDENGAIRHDNLAHVVNWDLAPTPCRTDFLMGVAYLSDLRAYVGGLDPGPLSMYFTPGRSNTGIPDFSDFHNAFVAGGLDTDGDGITDVHPVDYSWNRILGTGHLFPEYSRTSAMAYGEYSFGGRSNLTPFFELQYGRRDVYAETAPLQLYPLVPPDNPFNICNPAGINGVDCAVAWNEHYAQQPVIDMFVDQYGGPPTALGLGLNPPVGGMWIRPVVAVDGDRSITDTTVQQTRLVAGLRGDLPALESAGFSGAEFELAFVGSRSVGESHRPGIRGDWLEASLQTSVIDPSSGDVVCGMDATGDGIPDGVNADGRNCVPVNLFAPALYAGFDVDFATRAERDYLFDSRDFYTKYEQWLLSAHLSADLFELPGGSAAGILGFEFRNDAIDSIPDQVARDGLLFGFFSDGGAVGEKFTREYYGEVELPLVAGKTAAEELTVNLSGRYTADEFFGSDATYAARIGWRPLDALLLRATRGTSFRAPNLRENFIEPVISGNWIFDPCAVPEGALDPVTGYNPDLDPREPHVLRNCRDHGVDPEALDLGGFNAYGVAGSQGGSVDLVAETSKSMSLGMVWTPTVLDRFDLSLGWTYYEIEVADTITFPEAQAIIDDCYTTATPNSMLCSRIARDPTNGRISLVTRDYLNRDQLQVSGHDINIALRTTTSIAERPVDISADLVLNHPTEASETFIDELGNLKYDDDVGEWAYPEWKGTLSLRAAWSDWRYTWRTSYIGPVFADPDDVDDWGDVTSGSHTCLGPSQGDVLCRDVTFADAYITHATSLYYSDDTWTIGGGVRNILNEEPPIIEPRETWFSWNNVPVAAGYDLNGRVYFFNVQARFD